MLETLSFYPYFIYSLNVTPPHQFLKKFRTNTSSQQKNLYTLQGRVEGGRPTQPNLPRVIEGSPNQPQSAIWRLRPPDLGFQPPLCGD
jgi:hypothetical protein